MARRAAVVAAALVCGCGRVGFDELGELGDASGPPLTAAVSKPTINLGSKVTLDVAGGAPPYAFTVSGGGWIDASGTFVAPHRAGTSELRVIDAELAEATVEVTYAGSTLFMVGGIDTGTTIATVRSSADGLTWTTIGSLPAPRAAGSLVVFDDRMLYLGGQGAGAPTDEILASTDGVTWTVLGRLPTRVVSTSVTVHASELWWVSGYEGTSDIPGVFRSPDGITWTMVGDLPTPRHEHDVISRDDKLVVLGGHGAVLYDDLLESTDGATWTTSPVRLGFATDFGGVAELGDLVVRVCGTACSLTQASTDLAAWTTQALPGAGRDTPALAGFGGQFVLVGGPGAALASPDGLAWTALTTQPSLATITRTSIVQFTPP